MKYFYAICALLLMLACKSETNKNNTTGLNVLLITGGQKSALDYGFMESNSAVTPTLDSLASDGALITHGYLPSRHADENIRALLSGMSTNNYNMLVDSLMQQDRQKASFKTKEDMEKWKQNYPDGVLSILPTLPSLLSKSGYVTNYSGKELNFEAAGFSFNEDAVKFLAGKKEKPFLIYSDLKQTNDGEIMRIMQALRQYDLLDNTLIVYCQRQGMNEAHDLTYRTPIIMHAPSLIAKRKISNALMSTTDVMPTILDYLSLDIPKEVDGLSYRSVIEGDIKNERKTIFGSDGDLLYLRTSEYYFSWKAEDDSKILFELINDPACTDNMATYHPAKIAGFIDKLQTGMDQFND